jgi:hypothetical protein
MKQGIGCLLVVACSLVLYGCGGSATPASSSAPAGTGSTSAAALHCAPASAKPGSSATQTAALCAAEHRS